MIVFYIIRQKYYVLAILHAISHEISNHMQFIKCRCSSLNRWTSFILHTICMYYVVNRTACSYCFNVKKFKHLHRIFEPPCKNLTAQWVMRLLQVLGVGFAKTSMSVSADLKFCRSGVQKLQCQCRQTWRFGVWCPKSLMSVSADLKFWRSGVRKLQYHSRQTWSFTGRVSKNFNVSAGELEVLEVGCPETSMSVSADLKFWRSGVRKLQRQCRQIWSFWNTNPVVLRLFF